jgi:integrase
MIALRQALADYLRMRRSLGYKLQRAEKLLGQFLDYLDAMGSDVSTVEHALTWARQVKVADDSSWPGQRLSVVRGFAKYLKSIDIDAEVPPSDVLAWQPRRASPYLYSDEDIAALMTAAKQLKPPLRAATYQTLIGLLAVTGMRVGEAIQLDCEDFDTQQAVLVIRHAKFNKTRALPLHATTVAALRDYLNHRARQCLQIRTSALLVSSVGTRLHYANIQHTFQRLVGQAGLVARTRSCRPRLHNLRHSFAVHTFIDAYQEGIDPRQRLALLSTYLGHSDPGWTYWYLSAAPELLGQAGQRLERHRGDKP